MVPSAEPGSWDQHVSESAADPFELAHARIDMAAREHWAYLVGVASWFGRGSDIEVASDVVASAFETLLKQADRDPGRVVGIENMRAYLVQVVRRASLDAVRHHRRRIDLVAEVPDQAAHGDSPSELFEARELLDNIGRLVSSLPQRQREVVGLRAAGLSWPEVAEQLQLSRAAVERTYYRARSALAEELRDMQGLEG